MFFFFDEIFFKFFTKHSFPEGAESFNVETKPPILYTPLTISFDYIHTYLQTDGYSDT